MGKYHDAKEYIARRDDWSLTTKTLVYSGAGAAALLGGGSALAWYLSKGRNVVDSISRSLSRIENPNDKPEQAKITPKDRVAVVDNVINRMTREGIKDWEGLANRLPAWKQQDAHNKSQENAYDDLISIAAGKRVETLNGGRVQSPAEFLQQYTAADRTSLAQRGMMDCFVEDGQEMLLRHLKHPNDPRRLPLKLKKKLLSVA